MKKKSHFRLAIFFIYFDIKKKCKRAVLHCFEKHNIDQFVVFSHE